MVISIFLFEKPVFNRFLKFIGVQNQLPIILCSDLVCNMTLMVNYSTPTTYKFLTIKILLHIKSEQKVIRK